MQTIGLLGGMSWESTASYYRIINEAINDELGGHHSALCVLYSVDFDEIERWQANGEWQKAGARLGTAALSLENAGADFIIICSNTIHKVVEQIERFISIPIIHIADATAKQIASKNIRRAGLLGTEYTMEQDFYQTRMESNGIQMIVPNLQERQVLNKIIFEELCLGKREQASKEYYLKVMQKLVEQGAEGIILGCTEIGLLINQQDIAIPLFDTTYIHAMEAVHVALHNGDE